jgi:nucleoside-diphosphate-sugar epimerase
MPDCINSTIQLIEADPKLLTHRTYNVTSFSITPKMLYEAIKKYVPKFQIKYTSDPSDPRQGFADSWPKSLDDSHARNDWKWKQEFDLDAMVKDMLENLPKIIKK